MVKITRTTGTTGTIKANGMTGITRPTGVNGTTGASGTIGITRTTKMTMMTWTIEITEMTETKRATGTTRLILTTRMKAATTMKMLKNNCAFVNKGITAPTGLAWLYTVRSRVPEVLKGSMDDQRDFLQFCNMQNFLQCSVLLWSNATRSERNRASE